MRRNPDRLANSEYDLIVIGGGIYGACIAWDGALRGLSVALIERGDFGQETSANSLKTVHGGLRYLQDLDIGLVRTMIRERSAYLRIAPHLVQPLPCLTPTYSKLMKSKSVMRAALKMNDLAGFDRNNGLGDNLAIPASRVFSAADCSSKLPGLPASQITGGALWYDGQIYDTERFTLSFIISAQNAGAEVANYIEVTGLHQNGKQVTGVLTRDRLTGEQFEMRGKVIVNAAGPWVDRVLSGVGQDQTSKMFNHSLAINVITRKIIDQYAAGIPSWIAEQANDSKDSHSSHMLFFSPWRDYSIIGTFHSHYQGDPTTFTIEGYDLQAIIEEINSAYPGGELSLEDIKFVHFGFLPEQKESNGAEVKLVRKSKIIDHLHQDGIKGLISVVGVKYTTARNTAEKTIDLVFKHLERKPPECRTASTPIHGGEIEEIEEYSALTYRKDAALFSRKTIDHLVRSYGSSYSQVRNLVPGSEADSPLELFSKPVIEAQVLHSVKEEMAVKLSDVIFRRTGIGSVGDSNTKVIATAASAMAAELGWSIDRIHLEIDETRSKFRKHGAKIHTVEELEII
jgi:glycerol-3-phosphate dehydrogenase